MIGTGQFESDFVEKYSNSSQIIFHGALYGQSKSEYLRKCDVLVFPSTWPESFGIVITEAFAFGKPVIASKIGAIPETHSGWIQWISF